MAICPKCNTQIDDSGKFCSSCGHQMGAPVTDVKSGAQAKSGSSFAATLTAFFNTVVEKIKKIPKNWLLIGAAGIAAIIVLTVIISIITAIFGGNSDYTLYLKDEEIFFSDFSKNDPWQMTTDFNAGDKIPNYDISDVGYALSYYCRLANDGKTLFYVDKVDSTNYGVSLYYRNVKKPSQEPNKISSDVQSYSVNKKTTLVTYLKGVEGNLYQYSMKKQETEKIASEVQGYSVSEDGKTIIYMTKDDGLYYYVSGKDRVKIDSEIDNAEFTPSLDAVYYIKEGSLYRAKIGKDKEKLASDVNRIVHVVDRDTVYFSRVEVLTVKYEDYILDDKKETDATMVAPTRPTVPSRYDYDTLEEYNAAYEQYTKDFEKYDAAYEEYYKKQTRDSIREYLKDLEYSRNVIKLFYYDGNTELTVSNNYSYANARISGKAELVYKAINDNAFEKLKLSEITSKYNISDSVDEAISAATEWYVALGSESTFVAGKTAAKFLTNSEGTEIVFVDNISAETGAGELYKVTVKRGTVSAPVLYDNDVSEDYVQFKGDDLCYFKDVDMNTDKGELYLNKEKVDFDVYTYNIKYDEESGKLAYFVDWNEEKENGTLKVYNGKKSTKVSDDVYNCVFSADGKILYLYDYSTNYYKGDLYVFNKGKSKKMDIDVSAIIPVIK